ncbi:MAG: hypothetical protein ABI051_18890 [Vicinamibacterales bacterium]
MHSLLKSVLPVGVIMACGIVVGGPNTLVRAAQTVRASAVQQIDLAAQLADGRLKPVNREVAALQERPGAIHVAEREGAGVVWIAGTDFAEGTIEVEVRGRDVFQRSFVGVAFHGQDDTTYEAVYLRPFNFRTEDPARHQHAVQYVSLSDYDWPRLRTEFPEEFESPVDASAEPTGWVPLRVLVTDRSIQVYVAGVKSATLEVRKLGRLDRGRIGLWTGNNSDGAFANFRIVTPKG